MRSVLVTVALAATAAAEDAACEPASAGVCEEQGYPNPGVNVDDDCCAAWASSSCAFGYSYTEGGVCQRWDGGEAHSTCCKKCKEGEACDRGPGATCARPEEGVCMERGYPKIAKDNVDDDCCALAGKGWCGEGHGYTMGDVCYRAGHTVGYSTCCQPCNSTYGECDDGPGNDHPPPNLKALAIIGIVILVLCCGGICGGAIICWMCCRPNARPRPPRPGADGLIMERSGGSYVPVEVATVIGINDDPDGGIQLEDFGATSKNPILPAGI